jgi:4-diphosphocytidyl-2-C-methyl-D-erythritol kinase
MPKGVVIVQTPAKVNLFLEVLGKRPDGYHELATLMVAVSLFDTLEVKEDSHPAITLDLVFPPQDPGGGDRPALTAGPENLVWKAADLLRRRTGHPGGAHLRLHKQIPLAAGLAGGSSDAAATLRALNDLWHLGLSPAELAELGAELGSDVPFFLGGAAAWCTGRGEIVTPLNPGCSLWLVLVCPPFGLATASVFGALTPPAEPLDGTPLCRALERGDIDALAGGLFNRLQPVAQGLCPALAELDARLGQFGAGHLMSGSGTTFFVLCRDQNEAERVADELKPLIREKLVSRLYMVQTL